MVKLPVVLFTIVHFLDHAGKVMLIFDVSNPFMTMVSFAACKELKINDEEPTEKVVMPYASTGTHPVDAPVDDSGAVEFPSITFNHLFDRDEEFITAPFG